MQRPAPTTVRDIGLVALTFASGSADAIAFLGLGKVFSSFMTGNLVFLGLRIGGSHGPDISRVLSALLAFAVGVFLAVRIVKPSRGSTIWPARVSAALTCGAIAQAADSLGLSRVDLPSGAGHDSQNMAHLAPTGMIFVPSRGGLSHNPREFTAPEALDKGFAVLVEVLWRMVTATE